MGGSRLQIHSVRARLSVSFGAIVLFLAGLTGFSLWTLRAAFLEAQGLYDRNLAPVAQLSLGNAARLRMQYATLARQVSVFQV
jgi:hypothetical protein